MFILIIIAILVCVLLGLFVLIQNPKGGGLSSNFSSSSQLLGVQKTGDILEKGTWILAITLMCLSLLINVIGKDGTAKVSTTETEQTDKASKPVNNTAAPSPFGGGLKSAPAVTPPPAKK